MKRLADLRWTPRWVSQLGCVKSCCDFLGLAVSDGWLYGASGHAFVINVHEVVCPSGPTAWYTAPMRALIRNVGGNVEGIAGGTPGRRADSLREQAWSHARRAIDAGLPCFGWELQIPEYYVVNGYDETGYYFSGPLVPEGAGPKPWQDLGRSAIGVIELFSVRPGPPADDRTTVRQACDFALAHAASPREWIPPQYAAGLTGYERWIQALEEGQALALGVAYNAAVWGECRRCAHEFLGEAAQRLGGTLSAELARAGQQYAEVAARLAEVAERHPFAPGLAAEPIGRNERTRQTAGILRAAHAAEARGLETLATIRAALSG